MKKILALLLSLCIIAVPFMGLAEGETADIRVVAICDADDIEVGDQFLVQVMIDGDFDGYLTYSVVGSFNPEVAELIAPVYKDDKFSIIYNEFSNEDGKFQFDAADLRIQGSTDKLLCSLLFEAKSAGTFSLILGLPEERKNIIVGRTKVVDGKYIYSIMPVGLELEVSNATTRDQVVIIKEQKPLTPYNDMNGYRWAEIAVGALSRHGILDGIADESFEPGKRITRGEFIAMLIRGAKLTGGKDQFPDVAEDYPYAKEISIAKQKGIALGDGNGNFNPDDTVTRQDISAFVYRTLNSMGKMGPADPEVLAGHPDSEEISDYALPTMASIVRAGILRGDEDGMLNPKNDMTRAEAAVLIERVMVHIRLVL